MASIDVMASKSTFVEKHQGGKGMTNPYPESVFPPMDLNEASDVLSKAGISPDRVFGNWGRKVWDDVREATLKEVGESGVRIKLASCDGKPAVEFDDGDWIEQAGAFVDFLMHLSILMPNAELPDDLTIIPTKILWGEVK